MSDILIKGMGIPKDCKYVDVRIFNNGTATTSSAEEPFYKRMDVVEVPTPHGDLIGRDWLIDIALHLMHTAKNDEIANGVKWLWQYIIEAPTIIPESKEET